MYVCRFCIRWTEHSGSVFDDPTSLNLISDLFGLELECGPGFPRNVCERCCTLLEQSIKFYEQLIDTENALRRFREAGILASLLADPKKCGKTLGDTDSDNGSEKLFDDDALVQPMEEDAQLKTKQEVVDITIEPVEEFEIGSEPYGEDEGVVEQGDYISSDNREILDMHSSGQLDESEVRIDHETVEDGDKPYSTETNVAHIIVEPTPPRPTEDRGPVFMHCFSKCFICNTVLSNTTELKTHLLEHENLLPYRCKRCSTVDRPLDIESKVDLNNHLESHTFTFVCYQCPLRYRNYSAWRQHVSEMHPGPFSHTCGLCGRHFEGRRNFTHHMEDHRNMKLQRYKCAICGKAFRQNWLLKRHELIHSRNTRFKCPHCTRGFKHKSNFEAHQCHKWMHYRTDYEAFQCGRCPNKFASERYLRKHIDLKLHECTKCGKRFGYRQTLVQHLNMHDRVRTELKCKYCEKRFTQSSNLSKHEQVHTVGELNWWLCDRCGNQFRTSSAFAKHRRQHDQGEGVRKTSQSRALRQSKRSWDRDII